LIFWLKISDKARYRYRL